MYDVSGDFGQVRIIRNMIPHANKGVLDYYLSVGWHNCNSLYRINKPQGNSGILMMFTVGGEGVLIFNKNRYVLKHHMACIVPAGQPCEYFTPGNKMWEFYWIHIVGANNLGLINYMIENKGYVFTINNSETITARIEQLLTGYSNDLDSSRAISQLIYDLLENTNLNTSASKEQGTVDRVIKFIRDNYKKDITIKDMARVVHVSPDHLIRVFKKETGFTPYNYLKNYRLLKACDLLSFTNMSVKQISMEIGYKSESSFISQFKSFKSAAPGEYRTKTPFDN